MRLQAINLRNFRRYERARFHFHPHFTVIIGDNGKGKTTVLDAIAIMLGTYLQGSGIQTGYSAIRKNDARLVVREKVGQAFFEPQKEVNLFAEALIHGNAVKWRRAMGDRGGQARELVQVGMRDREIVSEGHEVELPLLLYYGAGRLWEIHRNIKTAAPGSQLDAYRFCLDPKSDQKAFQKWFKRLSYSELQKGKTIPALAAVRQAVLDCVPGAKEFFHDTGEDQIMISLEGEGLVPFNYLSDGYRNMAAMVADIAHRAGRLNPHFGETAARQTPGIVLIDEVDLHLHPKWQRRVVGDIQTAFPRLQFIATTHSPFILQSLGSCEVIDLNQSSSPLEVINASMDEAAPSPRGEYSNRSLEDITEDVMNVDVPQRSHRYQRMYEAAKAYYQVLQSAAEATPDERERLKRELDELSSPFSDNVAYHAFLEMERIAAGLGGPGRRGREE
ncbi:MAG: AAA family ATPase [Pseudomonadota bacterium]